MYKCIVCEDWYHDQCIQKVLISPSSITHLMSLIFCAKLPKEEDFEEFICWFCVADNPNLQCLHGRANCFSYSEYISVNWNPTDISTDSICLSLQSPEPNLSSIFLKGNWRDLICKCDKCLPLFSSPNLEILLREAPTFEPEPDLEAMIPTYEIALKALNNFSDKTALDSRLYAYERLRSSLSSFLLELSKHKKVVTKEVCTSDAKCLSKLNMPWLVGH